MCDYGASTPVELEQSHGLHVYRCTNSTMMPSGPRMKEARIAGEGADRDVSASCFELCAGCIDVVDGEAHMLETVIREGRRGSCRTVGVRGGNQHGLASDSHANTLLAGIERRAAPVRISECVWRSKGQ